MTVRMKILWTVFFVTSVAAILCSLPASTTTTIQVSSAETVTQSSDILQKTAEWVVILLLALVVWVWRKELKITSIGPLSGEPFTQQEPKDYRKAPVDGGDKLSALSSEIKEKEYKQRSDEILRLLRERHATNEAQVAQHLGITRQTAKLYLYDLIKQGHVRCDGFPGHRSLYTLSGSVENLTIDKVKGHIEEQEEIVSERRFVMLKHRYEIDAVFETRSQFIILEAKQVRADLSVMQVEKWVDQISQYIGFFQDKNPVVYLAIAVPDKRSKEATERAARNFTGSLDGVAVKILTYSYDELGVKEG